ncbi:hypothetical protein ARMSODRAFT_980259 [Armillaria solidipes]|uniref:Uncharacterized protein n=1 Tax=Armillaria solidipes TaxID=1076256 RepID=A0A2H3B2E9_9AGAR|nr:hypothetical protein ARMSODRAFT_980259 [Armillaria solidipes]
MRLSFSLLVLPSLVASTLQPRPHTSTKQMPSTDASAPNTQSTSDAPLGLATFRAIYLDEHKYIAKFGKAGVPKTWHDKVMSLPAYKDPEAILYTAPSTALRAKALELALLEDPTFEEIHTGLWMEAAVE